MGNSLMNSYHQDRDNFPPKDEVTLLDLPLLVMEKVSKYLSAEDVWQLGATCQQLRTLCTDDKLWRERILGESRTLILDGLNGDRAHFLYGRHHVTMTIRNPLFSEARLHWCTVRPRKRPETHSRGTLLDSWALITDLVTGHKSSSTPTNSGYTPRVLMYGSGLENKSVLRRMMMEKVDGLHVDSLVPSTHRGVGAGVRFRFSDGATFDLITLYSNTSEVRRRRTLGGAASHTPLYATVEEGGRLRMESFVLDLVKQADGIVHVVEAPQDKAEYSFECAEWAAMQEVVVESGRRLPLLTLQLVLPPMTAAEATPAAGRPQPPPTPAAALQLESSLGPVGWDVQHKMSSVDVRGPHAVLTTPCATLADLAGGFSWLCYVCHVQRSQQQASGAAGCVHYRDNTVTFPFGGHAIGTH